MPHGLTPEQRRARGRLWRVELDTLHAAVAESALRYLYRWTVSLAPGLPRLEDAAHTDLARTIRQLVAYARTGRTSSWDSADDAVEALSSASLLYAAPFGAPVIPSDWSSGASGDEYEGARGELAEVACAVLARVQIESRLSVPRPWLAALAGVSVKSVVKALAQGDLRSVKSKRAARGDGGGRRSLDVEHESARAWLIARGVEGVS